MPLACACDTSLCLAYDLISILRLAIILMLIQNSARSFFAILSRVSVSCIFLEFNFFVLLVQ